MLLDLIIPDLLPPRAAHDWQDSYRNLALPALQSLFARAKLEYAAGTTFEVYMCEHFGMRDQAPVAAFSRIGDELRLQRAYWLRADPVYLQAQREQLTLLDASLLSITAEEASALTRTLNDYFAANDFSILAAHPARWYIGLNTVPDMHTHALSTVAGGGMNAYLPSGADSMAWHQRINESQMLLHSHPVNAAREARGAPPINSIWLWGGGASQALAQRTGEHYWSDDALVHGLALAAGAKAAPLTADADALLAQASADQAHYVTLEHLRPATWYGDRDAWRATLRDIDALWIAPLHRALRDGQMTQLSVHAIMPQGRVSLCARARDQWRFWRRKRDLKHYAPG